MTLEYLVISMGDYSWEERSTQLLETSKIFLDITSNFELWHLIREDKLEIIDNLKNLKKNHHQILRSTLCLQWPVWTMITHLWSCICLEPALILYKCLCVSFISLGLIVTWGSDRHPIAYLLKYSVLRVQSQILFFLWILFQNYRFNTNMEQADIWSMHTQYI